MHKKTKTYGLSLLIVALLALLLALFWLYTGKFDPLKKRLFAQIPLPVARVGKNFLFWPQIAQRIKTSKALAVYDSAQVSEATLYNRTIDDRLLAQISRNQGIVPDAQAITGEFENLAAQNRLSPGQLEDELLAKYRISQNDFISLVLEPLWLRQQLQIWHSGNPELNSDNFRLAQKILAEIKGGKDFEELAQTYSQDESNRQLGGNLPALKPTELLPEIQKQLAVQAASEIQIIPSRLGLHIIKILPRKNRTPETEVKLQQIFLLNRQYAGWYKNQTRGIPIIKLRLAD